MKKYNQVLQYNLALEASITSIGRVCMFPEQFNQAVLTSKQESKELIINKFVLSIAEDKLFETEALFIGVN